MSREFLLCVAGGDIRKNMPGALQAFAMLLRIAVPSTCSPSSADSLRSSRNRCGHLLIGSVSWIPSG